MKQKNETVIYAGKGKSSEMIQRLLFSYGYTWNMGQKFHETESEISIYVYHDKLTLDFDYYQESIIFDIDGTKFFHEVISLCDRLKNERDNVDLEKEVKELRKWKDEYCELESKWDIQKVGQELGLSPGTLINPEILPGIQRLKREIAQLRDELDAKSAESFPEGYDWHNPHGLTCDQVGLSDGWRLLLKSEVKNTAGRDATRDIQSWTARHSCWCGNETYYGADLKQTYRTKLPLPSIKNTPTSQPDAKTVSKSTDDDFPTPERQEKEAGLRYFLGVLNSAKQVNTTTGKGDSKYRQFRFDYGEMFGLNGELMINGDSVAVQFQDGRIVDVNVISIEMF